MIGKSICIYYHQLPVPAASPWTFGIFISLTDDPHPTVALEFRDLRVIYLADFFLVVPFSPPWVLATRQNHNPTWDASPPPAEWGLDSSMGPTPQKVSVTNLLGERERKSHHFCQTESELQQTFTQFAHPTALLSHQRVKLFALVLLDYLYSSSCLT